MAANPSGAKWIPPLPQGWEARYDSANKSYFFIDHVNKKTQWEDPRFTKTAPHNKPQPQATATATTAASSLGQSRGPVQMRGGIALKDLSPHQRTKNQNANRGVTHSEAKLSHDVDETVVNRLRAEFPKASRELIVDMLVLCHNSERETREQLSDLGFLGNNSKGKNSSHVSPHHKSSTAAPATKKKSQEAHPLASPTRETPTPKKEPSEAEKKRFLSQIKGLFPKLDSDVVRLASQECHYALEEVKALLTAWEKRVEMEEQARAASGGSTSVDNSVASVHSFSPPVGSLEPVGLGDGSAYNPKSLGGSQPSEHPQGPHMSPKRTADSSSVTQNLVHVPKANTSSSSKSSCSQHARAKQVTKPKQSATGNQVPVITSQPAVEPKSKAKSQYRTEPKGPDGSLRKGPNTALLTSDYTQAHGPDKNNRAGPDRGHLSGPQGAQGPDRSLRCGPQSSLLQENGGTRPGVLVTHI